MRKVGNTSVLERLLGEKIVEGLAENKVYKAFVDGVAMNTFSMIYILNERFIAGMDWGEAFTARGAAAVGNLLTGRAYGVYNDWMRKKLGAENGKPVRKYLADVLAFATGQTPLYALYLVGGAALGGVAQGIKQSSIDPFVDSIQNVEWSSVRNAATFLTLVAPVLATPQKMTYDFVRDQFGIRQKFVKQNI